MSLDNTQTHKFTPIGFDPNRPEEATSLGEEGELEAYANLKLAAYGFPIFGQTEDYVNLRTMEPLLLAYQEKTRLLSDHLCPADQRIQDFLDAYLEGVDGKVGRLPGNTLVLDQYGLARTFSLPPDQVSFRSDIITSYRLSNGILHNPVNDRRTTKGVFHVTEGGLPIADDKKAVPKITFGRLLKAAFQAPQSLLHLPFTASQKEKAAVWTSLLLRPTVCPEVPGFIEKKSLEVRFFAPGNLISNLDFVESIFGNAGDPYLYENDAGLDVHHWTGHTGCVILAPHLRTLTKRSLGLPRIEDATDRQKRDGMCWESEDELYNEGGAFKITARDQRGVVVTLIADNYFGYCKKEVKTQISFAANLYGLCEEEHSGGALAYASYDLGEDFKLSRYFKQVDHTFAEVKERYSGLMELQPDGYGIDKRYPDVIYVPEDVHIDLNQNKITWGHEEEKTLRLLPNHTYILPSGYQVTMSKPTEGQRWRLVGTVAEGTFCHKPCTVSGGGKSEISKSLNDAMIGGPFYINDFEADFTKVEEIVAKEYGMRFRDPNRCKAKGRSFLSIDRSLGSVIKLLSPSTEYTDEYSAWLMEIPQHIKNIAIVLKRYYKQDWGTAWRSRFNVDIIDGAQGKELRYLKQKIVAGYLRIGFTLQGSWRTFVLRKDFIPAAKISQEDDITASVVVPASLVSGLNPNYQASSFKFAQNCEYRLFQRPDDAIHRGYDKKTEADLSRRGNFISNFEPLTRDQVKSMVQDVFRFEQYTDGMQNLLKTFVATDKPEYVVSSAHPRIFEGKPSENPRYLQNRPDLEEPKAKYLAQVRTRFFRRIPLDKSVPMPVNVVLPGRRNNPPQDGIRPLCVFNPIHYLELPELFMEFIASLTGKSPSTTGAGSEGALTKGPFNALLPIYDLNNALLSYILTGHAAFITSAGYIGPQYQVNHDISLLIPEIWCRMRVEEREAPWLIQEGYLEKCEDFEYNGEKVLASRLGWRITERFIKNFGGRIFNHPTAVFTNAMLKPETQDKAIFADGMANIVTAHQWVAEQYFRDSSLEKASPPLRALLNIMAYGSYEGKGINDPEIRALFEKDTVLQSSWYHDRLKAKQDQDKRLYRDHINTLNRFLLKPSHSQEAKRLNIAERLKYCEERLTYLNSSKYLEHLKHTLGVQVL